MGVTGRKEIESSSLNFLTTMATTRKTPSAIWRSLKFTFTCLKVVALMRDATD